MFGRKIKCVCGQKIDKGFLYCPHCGRNLKHIDEEKHAIKEQAKLQQKEMDKQLNNLTKELSESFGMPFINSFPFKLFVKKMSRDIEKQFKAMDMEMSRAAKVHEINIPKGAKETTRVVEQEGKKVGEVKEFSFPGGQGFSVNISLGGVPEESPEEYEEKTEKTEKIKSRKLSDKEVERLAKLPRKEPETKVRRLTDKIVYEIALPGVKRENDIFINKLQNSIEIKAFAKDKAYFKLIPLGLPIKRYKLVKEKLILELKP